MDLFAPCRSCLQCLPFFQAFDRPSPRHPAPSTSLGEPSDADRPSETVKQPDRSVPDSELTMEDRSQEVEKEDNSVNHVHVPPAESNEHAMSSVSSDTENEEKVTNGSHCAEFAQINPLQESMRDRDDDECDVDDASDDDDDDDLHAKRLQHKCINFKGSLTGVKKKMKERIKKGREHLKEKGLKHLHKIIDNIRSDADRPASQVVEQIDSSVADCELAMEGRSQEIEKGDNPVNNLHHGHAPSSERSEPAISSLSSDTGNNEKNNSSQCAESAELKPLEKPQPDRDHDHCDNDNAKDYDHCDDDDDDDDGDDLHSKHPQQHSALISRSR
ncbi:hypothetical protein KP509_01G054000 [Ceratopteris richardii]|uniref:Uncharacterized protein n=1 Tax=Ceratopteris richardii TaxID=49495 RepID=A0A8T2VGP1_CERRI|nr:hypothetical protein KP509_01G054000 [Ceratopteris richardii]